MVPTSESRKRHAMQWLTCTGFLALAALQLRAQTPTDSRVALPFTREYSMQSRVNGQTYRLGIAFPPDYNAGGADTTRYRVLYVLRWE